MKIENLISLIKELATVNTLHKEYTSDDIQFVIDANREDNIIKINVELKNDNKDKEEFEQWASQLDDEFFGEVWEALSEEDSLHSLNEKYESPQYMEVIQKFKKKARELAKEKISILNRILA